MTPAPDAQPWSRDELVRRLRAVGEARYHIHHPFNQRMHRGELRREELQLWVANRFCYQQAIPIKDAAIMSNCPEPAVRRAWIQRIAAILAPYRWIDPAGLEYFRARLQQAPRDAEHALALVTERCRTRELQERAVAALDFKCDVLWSLLDAVERGPLPGNAP